jgi:hypothetical protein
MGWDGVVGVAIIYGLDCFRFEPRQGKEIFCSMHPSVAILGSNQPPVQWAPGLYLEGYNGRGVALTTPFLFIAEVLEWVAHTPEFPSAVNGMLWSDLYLYL